MCPCRESKIADETEINFSDTNISDSQLQMFFAICHPCISNEAQICLALRILCGLGLSEIADAFLTNKETIHKRLQRAKEKLKAEKIKFEIPDVVEIEGRLNAVIAFVQDRNGRKIHTKGDRDSNGLWICNQVSWRSML